MLRRAVAAVAVLAFSVGLVVAAEIRGSITKVSDDGKTITVVTFDKATKTRSEPKDYTVSSTVKVLKGKRNAETKKLEAGEEISGGLTNEIFKKTGKRGGVRATITTDDSGNVTQIIAGGGGRGKGKGKKNNQ